MSLSVQILAGSTFVPYAQGLSTTAPLVDPKVALLKKQKSQGSRD